MIFMFDICTATVKKRDVPLHTDFPLPPSSNVTKSAFQTKMPHTVCAATPWTPQTDKLVSRAAIAAMKPTAVFLNVGRGRCVDEDALIEALRDHKIRGAALDVFAVEPLPESSPLWDLPNVVISPHSADRTAQFQVDSLTVFVEIVREFLGTGQLRNVCDKKAGY